MGVKKSGNKIRYKGVYRLYRNGVLVHSTQYNLLNAFDGYPSITVEELEVMTTAEIETRATAMIEAISGECSDFEIINNVIYPSADCVEEEDEFMIGQIIDFAGQLGKWDTEKWVECLGQTVAIVDYPELYEVIGREWTYDDDVPADRFNLPDLRGRVTLGFNEDSPDTPRNSDFDYKIVSTPTQKSENYGRVGNYGGKLQQRITGYTAFPHVHQMFAAIGATGGGSGTVELTSDAQVTANRENGGNLSYRMGKTNEGATVGRTGSSNDINNMALNYPLENRQPYAVVHKLIRYK
jgi:microcystin-dependent protein